MKRKKGFLRSWLFIGLIILVVFSLSGIGLLLAYKNGKFAKAQNPVPAPSEVPPPVRDIGKIVPRNINIGETFDINLTIPGMKDATSQVTPAEVMFVIDRSLSMSRGVSGNNDDCIMYINNIHNSDNAMWRNTRLCYAKTAVEDFIEKIVADNAPIKVGYQLFSSYEETIQNDDTENNGVRFWGLTDVANNPSAKTQMEADLFGAKKAKDYQMTLGTAVGPGVEKATRELVEHGTTTNKYIILLSDGAEHYENQPAVSVSGCRNHENGNWPDGWPPNSCADSIHFSSICGRLNFNGWEDLITPPMVIEDAVRNALQQRCDAIGRGANCALTCPEIRDYAENCTWQDPGCNYFRNNLQNYAYYAQWPGSPAYKAKESGVLVFAAGFYGGDINNRELMKNVAMNLYPQEPGGTYLINGYYCNQTTYGNNIPTYCNTYENNFVRDAFREIYAVIRKQNSGAPINVIETLASGATFVNIPGNFSVKRGGVDLGISPTVGSNAGRQTLSFTIPADAYNKNVNPNNQTFDVEIKNIQYSGVGCFEPDQNYAVTGEPLSPMPSYARYTFPISGGADQYKYMPHRRICVSAQYTGDVYGTNISNYSFPGIDVTVARILNNSTLAVWSLSGYNFYSESSSNYTKFMNIMAKVQEDLMKRRMSIGPQAINNVFTVSNPNNDIYPDGQVYYINGDVTISDSFDNIVNRATVIINGNLTISSDRINKSANSKKNVLLFVTGNRQVNITGGAGGLDLAIVAPNGTISIADTNARMKLNGFLIAGRVQLRTNAANAQKQSINYDPSFTLYPPPGLSSILQPIFEEIKP